MMMMLLREIMMTVSMMIGDHGEVEIFLLLGLRLQIAGSAKN